MWSVKLSYRSKWTASTTKPKRGYPKLAGCHTAPNERLLQQILDTNFALSLKVVIPLQMNGFYNRETPRPPSYLVCCHTAPNERLLQHISPRRMGCSLHVVIPLQMNGFYNGNNNFNFQLQLVVIPLQMNGFYNPDCGLMLTLTQVVIPLQMNGFNNIFGTIVCLSTKSCHTSGVHFPSLNLSSWVGFEEWYGRYCRSSCRCRAWAPIVC